MHPPRYVLDKKLIIHLQVYTTDVRSSISGRMALLTAATHGNKLDGQLSQAPSDICSTAGSLNLSQIEVEFKIHGVGNLHGDGMAIWVTEGRASPGTVFGHKDYFKGLGVFIDTYKNHRPGTVFPYVMAMLGNGTEPYDKDNDGLASELAGCSVVCPGSCFQCSSAC